MNISEDSKLWELCKKLWDGAEDKTKFVQKCNDYYEGKLTDIEYQDMKKSPENIILPIIDCQVNNLLDAQFSIAVVPKAGVFANSQKIKNLSDVADVYNSILDEILKSNDVDMLKERMAKTADISGYSVSQVYLDTKEKAEGEVKISFLNNKNVRIEKEAKCAENITYLGYEIVLPVPAAKQIYAKINDEYDLSICKKIDDMATSLVDTGSSKMGGVINYQNTDTNTSGQAYANQKTGGISAGKVVKLIALFMIDDSVYAPEKTDNEAEQSEKQVLKRAYPNGRIVTICLDDKSKSIFEDKAINEDFESLGNVDILNIKPGQDLYGISQVDNLISIQDRINRLINKYRIKLQNDFDTLLVPKDLGLDGGALVKNAVTEIENVGRIPEKGWQVISNDGIGKAQAVLEMINSLKKDAYELASINETMLYGTRQTGTTSAEQVEALQESPMTGIRAMQRQFKNWYISACKKALKLAIKNYTIQRMVKLTTNIDNFDMAKIDKDLESGQVSIELIESATNTVRRIAVDPEWDFGIECVAGTEVPRSRRELDQVMDRLSAQGLLGNVQDPDTIEMILKAKDIPNYRAIVSTIKRKKEEEAKKQVNIFDILNDPVKGKNLADLIKSLEGYSDAVSQLLSSLQLSPAKDKLDTAPVQGTIRQLAPDEAMVVAPEIISNDPKKQQQASEFAAIKELKKMFTENSVKEGKA